MQVVQQIKEIYGENLKENIRTVHNYLEMIFDYLFGKEILSSMGDYILKVIKEFPEETMGVLATPACNYLFKVHEGGRKMNEEQAAAFHHTVYQLLFAANRARRDIQMVVSFLTTQVKDPDKDD